MNVHYRGIASCLPGKGNTVSFWEDLLEGRIHADYYLALFRYALDPNASLQKLRNLEDLLDCFRIPMSRNAFYELVALQDDLSRMNYDTEENDQWTFIWGNQSYVSSRFYHYHFRNLHPERSLVWIWETKCAPQD